MNYSKTLHLSGRAQTVTQRFQNPQMGRLIEFLSKERVTNGLDRNT